MKKIILGVIGFVCLFANSASAQQASPVANEQALTFDIKIIDVSARTLDEIEKLAQDKNRLNQMVAEGKARIAASIQVKTLSGESNNLQLGQRVPWQRSESSQAQVQYENTGLNISVQPKITREGLIEVKLKIEMSGVIGDKNPSFFQRNMNHVVRLKPNETMLLLGFTQNETLWPKPLEQGKSADDLPRGNFFVLLNAKLTN